MILQNTKSSSYIEQQQPTEPKAFVAIPTSVTARPAVFPNVMRSALPILLDDNNKGHTIQHGKRICEKLES